MLAVGLFRGWRPALAGTALAALVLAAIVIVLGTAIDSFPVADAQIVVGMFLLLFGLRWLHKAILRQAGLKALHDEAEEFEATKQALSTREHWVAVTTAFNGVLLEGVEVVLIVIALGGVGHRAGAVVGASAALLAVIVAGVALRAPLTRIPENLMKATRRRDADLVRRLLRRRGDRCQLVARRREHPHARRALRDALRRPARGSCGTRAACACRICSRRWRPRSGGSSSAAGCSRWGRSTAVLAAALLVAQADDAAGWAALLLVAGVVTALLIAVAGSRRLE